MSVSHHRGGWEVRWRDAAGRRRAKRFLAEDAARAFDAALAELGPAQRRADTARSGSKAGIYSYRTADGPRWRFVYRRSDGTQTTKRGFTSERAARDARRRLLEQVERGEVRHTKETFGDYWARWLARRKPYLEPGTWSGYEINGRKRLLPAFAARSLGELSVDDVREFVAEQAEAVDAGELAVKTVNNTLVTLVVCLNDAVADALIVTNPALRVDRLPPAHIEREYLPARRDRAIPRRVLSPLPAARRAAHRQRSTDRRGAGASRRRSRTGGFRRRHRRIPLAQARHVRLHEVRPNPLG